MNFNQKIFFVYCSTGCSCCSNENHYRGPFSTREIAQKRAEFYRKVPILASQYASRGSYEIISHKAIIIDSPFADRDGFMVFDSIILDEAGRYFLKFEDNTSISCEEELKNL